MDRTKKKIKLVIRYSLKGGIYLARRPEKYSTDRWPGLKTKYKSVLALRESEPKMFSNDSLMILRKNRSIPF
jgi:hypothetical protein